MNLQSTHITSWGKTNTLQITYRYTMKYKWRKIHIKVGLFPSWLKQSVRVKCFMGRSVHELRSIILSITCKSITRTFCLSIYWFSHLHRNHTALYQLVNTLWTVPFIHIIIFFHVFYHAPVFAKPTLWLFTS